VTSLIETFLGYQISGSIDDQGVCTHACSNATPFFICEIEANELNRFDPDAYATLSSFGTKVEAVTIDDIDKVGEKIHLLNAVLSSYGDGKNEFLYKYALSKRTKKPLLVSLSDPHNSVHVECTKKFKNLSKIFP
jgi:hypothetical protein